MGHPRLAGLRLGAALVAALAASACSTLSDQEELGIDVFLHNAQGAVDGGHDEQALDQFRKALSIEPSNRKARLGEAFALLALGQREDARAGRRIQEAEEKFAALKPGAYGENAWKVHLGRGMVHARLAALWRRKARLAAGGVGEGDAGAEEAMTTATKEEQRHEQAATAAFSSVLETDHPMARDNLTALFYLARRRALDAATPADYEAALAYCRRFEVQVERSKELWRSSMEREPEYAGSWEAKLTGARRQELELRDLMANLLFKLRRHTESIAELDRVLEIDPLRASAYFNRARNHEELGRYGSAADDYRRFISYTDLGPLSEEVMDATERLRECENRVRADLVR